ncbi:hypothetical protein BD310DRAFT_1043181 [Dichomitus squalens]|uniref:NADP-dependent oxidoreductase domain-containing protein n=1 Tax=Dichomitus squalens TaxID=114155 RepID=A0A4Q9PBR1_9APHY|nr:hypothetical protein BD310DRAFT_1043181 [Dichomitus squalens]
MSFLSARRFVAMLPVLACPLLLADDRGKVAGDDILAIPGSRNPANIKENIGAVDVKLTAEEVDLIRKAAVNADQADVPRYPPAFQALLMVDTPSLG